MRHGGWLIGVRAVHIGARTTGNWKIGQSSGLLCHHSHLLFRPATNRRADLPGGSLVGPKSLGGSRGKPEILDMFTPGTDEKTAQRLWELSEEILGETFAV